MLVRLGFPRWLVEDAAARAEPEGAVAERLVADGQLDRDAWWPGIADALGLRFSTEIEATALSEDDPLPPPTYFERGRQIWIEEDGVRILVVAPRGPEVAGLAGLVARDPALAERVRIAAPETIRTAQRRLHEPALRRKALRSVIEIDPNLSAAGVAPDPKVLGGLMVLFLAGTVFGAHVDSLLLLFLVFQAAFVGLGVLRIAAAADPAQPTEPPPLAEADLPTYAVLVPLYQEAPIVPRLVAGLGRIDYPADRLFVKLVVEADDQETLSAARTAIEGTRIEVVAVSPSEPRTKPKALNYALAMVDAEYVTIFDAEDRPDPAQLRKAAAAFAAGPGDLVCVQAALDVDHAARSRVWIARQFSLEYAMLFGGLLPWLAARGCFFPLGGTSNHFRRSALVGVGGWDPHNVTEDADIAVRLRRAGGRLGMIPSATSEEAPVTLRAWLAQRTRWLKGWLVTWIVHMRRPVRLFRDIGLSDFLLFQGLIAGQILSALAYPAVIVAAAGVLVGGTDLLQDRSFVLDLLLSVCIVGFVAGHAGALWLALGTDRRRHIARLAIDLPTMPVYWLLVFVALVAAVVELALAPHRWNKTAHGIAHREDPLAETAPGALSVGR